MVDIRTNLTNCATTQFRVLSDDQVERIYLGALEVLERTGSKVLEGQARQLLAAAGARVDGEIARLPCGLVEDLLPGVPRRIAVANRLGQRAMILESHRIYYGTGSDCPFIDDPASGGRREFTKKDIADAARVVDACPNLDFHMSLGLTRDVPTYSYDRHQAATMLRNTVKPLVLTAMSREAVQDILEIHYLVCGGPDEFEVSPRFVVYIEPTTPLVHSRAALEKLLLAAERRVPAIYTPCPMAGATAPVTLAGVLVVAVAEFLAGMAVSQLKRRGAPLIMGGVVSTLDLRTAILTYGSPELHLMSAALTDIAHWLGLPTFSTAGCSDSKVLDEQAAVEAALSALAAGLSGANLIHDVGFLESGLVGSHELIVLSDEVIGMVKRFLSGVRVDDETLALEVIDEVGPGGHFLAHQHTARHFRQEHWFPSLMDRSRYGAWQEAGCRSLGERVRERTAQILQTHRVPPLPGEVEAGIDAILARADGQAGSAQTRLV